MLRCIGPFTVVEEGGDLNYRLTLPPYMKTHPVFYVGRLKRYVDPNKVTNPHPKVTESEVKDLPPTFCPYDDVVDSESEEHHANKTRIPQHYLLQKIQASLQAFKTLSILRSDFLKIRGQSQDLTLEIPNASFSSA